MDMLGNACSGGFSEVHPQVQSPGTVDLTQFAVRHPHQGEQFRGGFFVEFGATNGIDLSNSYLLQSKYYWTGILAEPARCWRDA